MKNIKYTIDEIIRKPGTFFIIVIQIVIGTIILLSGISAILKTWDISNSSKNMFNGKQVYRLLDKTSTKDMDRINNSEDSNEKFYELYSYLRGNENFSISAQQNSNILIKDFSEDKRFYYDLNEKNKYSINPKSDVQGKFSNIKGYYIDSGYNNEFPLETTKGRTLNEEDFTLEDDIPIILGAEYENIYNVGDEFKYFDYLSLKEKKMKVIGILKADTYFFEGGSIITLDDKVICPLQNLNASKDIKNKVLFWLSQCIIVTDNEQEALSDIRDKSSQLELYNFKFNSCEKDVKYLIDQLSNNYKTSMKLSITIFLFISIGIITVQLNGIKERVNEYGIHLLSGATKRDIVIRILYSTAMYLGIGMLIGTYFEYFSKKDLYGYYYDNRILFIIYVLLVFIISYLPYRKIHKLEVNNIIRGLSE